MSESKETLNQVIEKAMQANAEYAKEFKNYSTEVKEGQAELDAKLDKINEQVLDGVEAKQKLDAMAAQQKDSDQNLESI